MSGKSSGTGSDPALQQVAAGPFVGGHLRTCGQKFFLKLDTLGIQSGLIPTGSIQIHIVFQSGKESFQIAYITSITHCFAHSQT